jgi:hypothetical protein
VERVTLDASEAAALRKRKLDAAFGKIDLKSAAGKQLLAAESRNAILDENHKRQKRDGLFTLLEKREDAAAAVDSVTKVAAKVYKCEQCRTVLEFPSSVCRRDNHKITTQSVTKRFFECNNCHHKVTYVVLILSRSPSYTTRTKHLLVFVGRWNHGIQQSHVRNAANPTNGCACR